MKINENINMGNTRKDINANESFFLYDKKLNNDLI